MKVFEKVTLLLVTATVLAGCQQAPDYSDAPSISFKDVEKTVVTENGLKADRLEFTISFTDGDGNLGLNTTDTKAPFNYQNPDSSVNPNFYNWLTTFYIKQNGEFVPFQFPQTGFTYNGRFPRLVPDGKPGPIDGTITYAPTGLFQVFFPPNTIAKFTIQIMDRTLLKSNIVETGEIILNEQ